MSRWLLTANVNDISKLSKTWKDFYNLVSTTDDTVPGIQEILNIQPSLNTIGESDVSNEYDESSYKKSLNEAYNLLNKLDEQYPEYHETYNKLMEAAQIPSISNLGEIK